MSITSPRDLQLDLRSTYSGPVIPLQSDPTSSQPPQHHVTAETSAAARPSDGVAAAIAAAAAAAADAADVADKQRQLVAAGPTNKAETSMRTTTLGPWSFQYAQAPPPPSVHGQHSIVSNGGMENKDREHENASTNDLIPLFQSIVNKHRALLVFAALAWIITSILVLIEEWNKTPAWLSRVPCFALPPLAPLISIVQGIQHYIVLTKLAPAVVIILLLGLHEWKRRSCLGHKWQPPSSKWQAAVLAWVVVAPVLVYVCVVVRSDVVTGAKMLSSRMCQVIGVRPYMYDLTRGKDESVRARVHIRTHARTHTHRSPSRTSFIHDREWGIQSRTILGSKYEVGLACTLQIRPRLCIPSKQFWRTLKSQVVATRA